MALLRNMNLRRSIPPLFTFVLCSTLAACGGAQKPATSSAVGPKDVGRYFPARFGAAWSYDVNLGDGQTTLAVSRVEEQDGKWITINVGGTMHRYEVKPEGIWRTTQNAWLLKAPLEKGASWPAAGQSQAVVVEVGQKVKVKAGVFDNCIIIEERAELHNTRTTYCADIGMVEMTTRDMTLSPPREVHAVLRGYIVDH